MAKRMRATSPMKSTIRVGSITQPLAAVTARSWLVVAWLVFMETSFRQKSTSNIDMISLGCQMSRAKGSFGPESLIAVRAYKLITSIHSDDLEKSGVKNCDTPATAG